MIKYNGLDSPSKREKGSIPAQTFAVSMNSSFNLVNLGFENKAPLINPTLAVDVTEKIKDVFISQSSLRLATYDGDMIFEGTIAQYDVRPVAIQGNETAASNRLTIGIKVKYTCEKYPEDSWEKTFSQFSDFGSTQNLSDVEQELVKDIVARLGQDVFNKALSNW